MMHYNDPNGEFRRRKKSKKLLNLDSTRFASGKQYAYGEGERNPSGGDYGCICT
jgi:hypothetical protein